MKMCPIFWSMLLPPENSLSVSLEKIYEKGMSWVRVGQMYKDEYSLHRPDVLFCNEGGKIGVAVVKRDTPLAEAKSLMVWQPCPKGRIPVRIAWSETEVKAWMGNDPVPCVSETRFAEALSSTRQFPIYYSFRGDNIRMYDIKATIE